LLALRGNAETSSEQLNCRRKEKVKIMYAKIVSVFMLCLFVTLLASPPAEGVKAKEETEAIAAAKAWLALVDDGKYDESWSEAATYFRNAVEKAKWQQQMEAFRDPLGEITSRTVKNAKYYTSLPGAPDGEYVVIQFETSFANKEEAIETVTPMRDDDGSWRVSGYYIK
jgi:hypothetical protein